MWWWLLLWTVLVVGAGLVLFRLGLRVFRSGVGLAEELGTASERFAAIASQVEQLSEHRQADPGLAVFDDPQRLKRERARRDRRRRLQRARAVRRRTTAR
ncbi:MAG: hypothetical protein ACLGIV_09245 [Actinomycetes bacterium]